MILEPSGSFENFLRIFEMILEPSGSFENLIRFCSMGSKLAPILSNIFMSLIEKKVVSPLIQSGKILSYKRYVDDCFIVLKNRDDIDFIFDQFNSAHKGLKFTKDLPVDGILNFLDLSIYFDRSTHKYEFKQYCKEIKSKVMQNFKHSCSPLSYKNGTLIGEIYRAKYCSSNLTNLKNCLKSLEDKFVNNGYPRKLVRAKIREVQDRNFEKKERAVDFEKEKRDNPDKFHTVCLNFTSERCQKVERFIKKFIRELTPDFNVSFAWKSVSLNNIILPRLKRRVLDFDSHSVVYRFRCDCDQEYIGETKRLLSDRASEHGHKSNKSEVSSHIFECQIRVRVFKILKKFSKLPEGSRIISKILKKFSKHTIHMLLPYLTKYRVRE